MGETAVDTGDHLQYSDQVMSAFVESLAECLEHYAGEKPLVGASEEKQQGEPEHGEFTGVISITGSRFLGSMGLNATREFLEMLAGHVFQGQSTDMTPMMFIDLMGEFCNQVIGRVKIKFNQIGLTTRIGLPEVVVGKDHIIVHKVNNAVVVTTITLQGRQCSLEFCFDITDVEEQKDEVEEAANPGDVLLF